jgi:hypothetical protein
MRRSLLWLVGLVLGTTLLVGLKSPAIGGPQPSTLADAPLDPSGSGAGSGDSGGGGTAGATGTNGTLHATTGPGGVPQPSSHPGSGGTPGPSPSTPSGGSTAPAGGSTTPPGGPPTTATTPPTSTVTVTGGAVAVITAQSPNSKSSPCGPCHDYSISVTITVSNGRITSAQAAFNPSPGASLSYASRADSALRQTILSAQTWNLGRVSGATYSANAWELSVRDAMAKAGLPT